MIISYKSSHFPSTRLVYFGLGYNFSGIAVHLANTVVPSMLMLLGVGV